MAKRRTCFAAYRRTTLYFSMEFSPNHAKVTLPQRWVKLPREKSVILGTMTVSELQEHLYALEERLLHPDRAADRTTLLPFLANDFQEFCASGRVSNRQQTTDDMLSSHPRTATIHHYFVTPLCETAALATYRLTTATSVTYRSSLWVFRDKRWQLFFHQGTPAA